MMGPQIGLTRRRALALAGTALLAPACQAARTGPQAAATPGAPAAATIHYSVQLSEESFSKVRAPLEEYQRRYPQVTIQISNFPSAAEYVTKLQTMFVAGNAPDVMWLPSRSVLPYADQGVLDEVTRPLASRKLKPEDFYELAMAEGQYQGKYFAVPQGWGVGVIGINKTLAQNAGVQLKPDFDLEWTHDQFIAMMKQVARLNDQGDLTVWGVDYNEVWPLWWDFGADILDRELKRAAVNTAQGAQALQWWHDLSWVHRVQPRPSTPDKPSGVDMWNTSRQLVSANAGPFILANWAALTFDYDIYYRPRGPAGRFHRWYTDVYSVNATSKIKDPTYDLLAFIVGAEGQTLVERAGGRSIPGHKQVAETVFLKENPTKVTKRKWLDAGKVARKQPLIVKWDDMNTIVNNHRNAVLGQKETPKDAVAAMEQEINVLLGAK
jgi:ABC-type glycerol-3-phosphate transport system substrate-binding protein